MRPIWPAPISANHTAPPAAWMPTGAASAVGSGEAVISPAAEILPMAPAWLRVHHSAPSGPAVISEGMLPAGSGNSCASPSRLIRPTRSAASRVYHSAPSGPAHTPYSDLAGEATGTDETSPAGVTRPIRPSPRL